MILASLSWITSIPLGPVPGGTAWVGATTSTA
jgi:hypothetical protein